MAEALPVNVTVSPTSNSKPVPDNVNSFVADVPSTCRLENKSVAVNAATELPNGPLATSTNRSFNVVLTELTTQSDMTFS